MRLSEALIQRADTQKRILHLQARLQRTARIQEGEKAPEDPQELFAELAQLIETLTPLIAKINLTNSQTAFNNTLSLTEALAERDAILLHRRVLEKAVKSAVGEDDRRAFRFNQVKSFSTINVSEVQVEIDRLSRRYRELDTRIQEINWTTDLIE